MRQAKKTALMANRISGAYLDVLSTEPPDKAHPLLGLENCVITPHQAWATKESRKRLIDIAAANIRAFLDGRPVNVVNP